MWSRSSLVDICTCVSFVFLISGVNPCFLLRPCQIVSSFVSVFQQFLDWVSVSPLVCLLNQSFFPHCFWFAELAEFAECYLTLCVPKLLSGVQVNLYSIIIAFLSRPVLENKAVFNPCFHQAVWLSSVRYDSLESSTLVNWQRNITVNEGDIGGHNAFPVVSCWHVAD